MNRRHWNTCFGPICTQPLQTHWSLNESARIVTFNSELLHQVLFAELWYWWILADPHLSQCRACQQRIPPNRCLAQILWDLWAGRLWSFSFPNCPLFEMLQSCSQLLVSLTESPKSIYSSPLVCWELAIHALIPVVSIPACFSCWDLQLIPW